MDDLRGSGHISWTIATRKEDLTPQEMEQRQAEFMKQYAGKAHA